MQSTTTVTAPANIAFVKHWGLASTDPVTPRTGSLSMNLSHCTTTTTVTWSDTVRQHTLQLTDPSGTHTLSPDISPRARASYHLIDTVKRRAQLPANVYATITSTNSFPTGAGIASSASGLSALTFGLHAALPPEFQSHIPASTLPELCALGGSLSALRSLADGFTQLTHSPQSGFTVESIAAPDHWALLDIITVVDATPKSHGSWEGHLAAHTSPLQADRLTATTHALTQLPDIITQRDWPRFASITLTQAVWLHAVMLTSQPSLSYLHAGTITVMNAITQLAHDGHPVTWTLDAGANLHIICPPTARSTVLRALAPLSCVTDTIINSPTRGAHTIE